MQKIFSEDDELLTPAQVAEELQLTPSTLANWRSAGTGPDYVKLGTPGTHGKSVRYRRCDVAEWIKSRRVQTS